MNTSSPFLLASAKFQQAVVLHENGFLHEAQTFYEEAIQLDPNHYEALHSLGLLMFETGNPQKALELILIAIENNPHNPDFFNNLGIILENMQEFNAALVSYEAAIALKPDAAEIHFNRGNILKTLQHWEAAISSYDHAIALKPDFWQAISNRGQALKASHQLNKAITSFQQALAINPNAPEIYSNLGNALEETQQFEAAIANHNHAIYLKPDYADGYVNRGNTYLSLNDLDHAQQDYKLAINLNPDHADAHWHYGLLLLLTADFANGWQEYEWRWKKAEFSSQAPTTHHHRWKPGSMTARLLIWAEQDLNNHILFSSLLPEASLLAEQLLVKIDERLIPLLARAMPEISFIPHHQAIEDELFDAHLPLCSLGKYLRPSTEAFRIATTAYMVADKNQSEALKQLLDIKEEFLIGIAWNENDNDAYPPHYPTLQDILSHLQLPGIKLVSLLPINQNTIDSLKSTNGIDILPCPIDNQNNVDALAALIDACDLVISTDNIVAYLAGALHKAAWILLPARPNWLWQQNNSQSPWHPTLKLYRQHDTSNWQPILRQLVTDLHLHTANHKYHATASNNHP